MILHAPDSRIRRARLFDRFGRIVISIGGVAIIVCVVMILLLIVAKVLPLWQDARAVVIAEYSLPDDLDAAGVLLCGIDMSMDETLVTGWILTCEGRFVFLDLSKRESPGGPAHIRETIQVRPPAGSLASGLRSAAFAGGSRVSLLWTDGSTSLVDVQLAEKHDAQGIRSVHCNARTLANLAPHRGAGASLALLCRASESGALTRAAVIGRKSIAVLRQTLEGSGGLFANAQTEVKREVMLEQGIPGEITALAMSHDGETLYAGTCDGIILVWSVDGDEPDQMPQVVHAFGDRRPVTALAMVLGDVSLAVGDGLGGLSTWFSVGHGRDARLRKIHSLSGHESPVRLILPSQRTKTLASLDQDGVAHLDHMTSERRLMVIAADQPLSNIALGTRENCLLGLDLQSGIKVWRLDNPHPEFSLGTLFGLVHYEGYTRPSYTWQTTGGLDFEAKFSLVPLLLGTFKGTFYAMLLAVPIALLGAMYVSQFTSPAYKRMIKPVVEIMAAVPSVVIGFLAALWLAPIVADWIVAVFISVFAVPAVLLVFLAAWSVLESRDWARRIGHGREFILLIPFVIAGVGLAVLLAGPVEAHFFAGSFRQWMFDTLQERYDQRNCIVIAFGLGFTVMPIIFSIAEDALSSVPYSLKAASMALGASRWQTAWHVTLPSGSPGIFAAIMIGFGRAVGETMIVLMATGNTPILDWSPFNGMRTLSANIAVEIPEVAVDGTLYRILFLCAVLLFALTFMLNTVAEVVRQHLRKKYGQFQ